MIRFAFAAGLLVACLTAGCATAQENQANQEDQAADADQPNGHVIKVVSATVDEEPAPPPARPYKYASLKGLADEAIAAYMGDGKKAYMFHSEQMVRTQVPKDFWALPPREAALAMADANRSPQHRKAYRVALDDGGGRKPPEACSVYVSYRSSRCYTASDSKYFLLADPRGSYLVFSSQWDQGAVFYNVVEAHPIYDLRLVALSYEEARHVAQVVWWLNRVRTQWHAVGGGLSTMMMSSADGHAAIRMTSGGREEILARGTAWADCVSERWTDDYGPEVFLNLVDHLFRAAVPEHLERRWTDQQPLVSESLGISKFVKGGQGRPAEAVPPARRERQARDQVGRLIGLFSSDQSRLAHAILMDAVQEAGDFALADCVPHLRAIQTELPAPQHPVLTREEVGSQFSEAMDEEEAGRDREESSKLFDRLGALELGIDSPGATEELRRAVGLALRKIEVAADAERLQSWAQSHDEGWQWALRRLRRDDPKRYVAALEWLLSETRGKWARQIFEAVAEVDAARAEALAARMPADTKGDLTVPAFALLEKAKVVSDVSQRIDALLAVALDPKSDWDQRLEAIDCLVPREAPLRYPDRKIDEAMVKLFDPALADDSINFTLARACRALALRGRLEYFDRMAELLTTAGNGGVHKQVLLELVTLARQGGAAHRDRILRLLEEELGQPNRDPSDAALCAYVLDLRALKGRLESIATAGPDDYEDACARPGREAPAAGRYYHVPRKVAAIWNEEDALTRGRLLAGLCLATRWSECKDMVRQTAGRQLVELAGSLPQEDRRRLVEFAAWYRKILLKEDKQEEEDPGRDADFIEFLRMRLLAKG